MLRHHITAQRLQIIFMFEFTDHLIIDGNNINAGIPGGQYGGYLCLPIIGVCGWKNQIDFDLEFFFRILYKLLKLYFISVDMQQGDFILIFLFCALLRPNFLFAASCQEQTDS